MGANAQADVERLREPEPKRSSGVTQRPSCPRDRHEDAITLFLDLEPGRPYQEMSKTAHELRRIGPQIANFKRTSPVAILYSSDSYWGIEFMKFNDHDNYRTILKQMYHVLYKSNVGIDFVFPDSTNFSDYKVIVVPPLYVASDALLNKLVDYVRNGGHVVMAFKSGFTNEFDTVRWTTMPGPLREAAGFHYQEFSNLRQPLALKGDPFHAGEGNKVSDFRHIDAVTIRVADLRGRRNNNNLFRAEAIQHLDDGIL